MAWPRSFVDEVRRSIDAVRLIGEVVALKKRGARWVGLCPFHQEKTPSFTVSEEGLWYCFGCGEGGDVFKFVQQHEGVGFAEAARSLAERAGVAVPEPERGPGRRDEGARVPRARLLAALAAAESFYGRQLSGEAGGKARSYLAGRGLSAATIERFSLGWAPAGWDRLHTALGGLGFAPRELEAAGLVKRRADGSGVYDLLRARIIFPIQDLRGRTIALGGRVLDGGEPKYLNSPETSLFVKSKTLYGLALARDAVRQSGFVVLVEGYLDLLACAQHGFHNVVAPLGTAFTSDHARLLSSHCSKAVVVFDGDESGRTAAERTVGIFLASGFQVSVGDLPQGQDPDSFLRERGPDAFADVLRSALPALSFLVRRTQARADVRTPRGKAQAVDSLLQFVLRVQDRVERAEWIGRIADALQVDEHLVARNFEDLRRTDAGRSRTSRTPVRSGEPARVRLEQVPLAERDLLRAVLSHPGWLPRLEAIYGAGAIRDPRVAELLEAIGSVAEGREQSVRADEVLGRCQMEGADRLLSRVLAVGSAAQPPSWEYARACALGIRRDALRRELQAVQRQIEQALQAGTADVGELQERKLELARQIRGQTSSASGAGAASTTPAGE